MKPSWGEARHWLRSFLFLVACFILVTYFAYSDLERIWLGIALIFAGVGVYLFWKKQGKRADVDLSCRESKDSIRTR